MCLLTAAELGQYSSLPPRSIREKFLIDISLAWLDLGLVILIQWMNSVTACGFTNLLS